MTVESTAGPDAPRRNGGKRAAGAPATAAGKSQETPQTSSSTTKTSGATRSRSTGTSGKTSAGDARKSAAGKPAGTTRKAAASGSAAGKATKASKTSSATKSAPAGKTSSASKVTKAAQTTKASKASAGRAATAGTRTEPDQVQLLTPDGERVEHPEYSVDLTPEELRGLYRDMVLTRRFDAEATALQRQGELGLWASLLGQEAAQIGSGRALRDDDYVFPTYREHGVAWCRGVDPANLLGMFRGVNNGGWDPNSNNFHLYTIVIGSQALHATGYAMGVAMDGADSAVVAYFGDGASSQGDVAEAFTFAAVYNAPVVFFCQNNQWAISEPAERQSRVPLYQRAQGYGFPGIQVDGNDVLAVLAVTRAALERARSGQGPMLIEASTYRMGAHTTADDPTRYRRDDEREAWEAKDPIARLRAYLEKQDLVPAEYLDAVDEESEKLARRVRETVRGLPDPDTMAIFENVYADGHALVDEERAQFAEYLASFADEEGN